MKIAIIIKGYAIDNYENQQFLKSAQKLQINLKFLLIEKLSFCLDNQKITIYYEQKEISHFDYVIIRTGSATTSKDAQIIEMFELTKMNVINNGQTVRLLQNKLKTLALLQSYHLPIIKTMVVGEQKDLDLAIKKLHLPLIIKSNRGSLGIGIYKLQTKKELENFYHQIQLLDKKYYYLLQEDINYKIGVDIRVLVVNKKIVKIMKRVNKNDFKANYAIANQGYPMTADQKIMQIVEQIIRIVNCDIMGIDLLYQKNSYVICEINSAPGFYGLEQVYPELNVADIILTELKDKNFTKIHCE